MNERERVMRVLTGRRPDRPPWIEIGFHTTTAARLIGRDFAGGPASGFQPLPDAGEYRRQARRWLDLAARVGLDAVSCKYWLPGLAGEHGGTGFNDKGLISSCADLERESQRLPRMDERDYSCGEILLEQCRKAGVGGFLQTHFLSEQTIYSFGFAEFCYMLYEDRALVEKLMDFFTDYSAANIRNLMKLGPDFLVVADDLAYGQGPFVSPEVFRELFMPRYRRLAAEIRCPWIFHSDGNLIPIMDDLLSLGMNAIHPIEPYGTMDIAAVKRDYGDRVVLAGNLDMNVIANGTTADIEREVCRLWDDVGVHGGWILSSSNSIDAGARPENVLAMGAALRRLAYG